MGFLQRLGLGRPSIGDRLNRLNHGAQLLMKHVGLTGRCDCVHMRDPDGGTGFLLQIQTPLLVPVSDREEFQQYFGRKLSQFAGLDDDARRDELVRRFRASTTKLAAGRADLLRAQQMVAAPDGVGHRGRQSKRGWAALGHG